MSARFIVRRVIDAAMTAAIILLLASQVTGRATHEWLGIAMAALVVSHIVLNRAWYGHLFKGAYRPARIFQTAVDLLLLVSFAVTAVTGILMSQYAVPFLRVTRLVGTARMLHLAFSHWSFALAGFHLGLHWGMITHRIRRKKILWRLLSLCAVAAAGYGLFLSVRAQIYSYMFFQVQFAFLDYSKAPALAVVENILILSSWVFIAWELTGILKKPDQKDPKRRRTSAAMIAAAAAVAVLLFICI